jgi:hypothetical protein
VELIRSGDTFYMRRHDGLATIIAWSMGVNHGNFNNINLKYINEKVILLLQLKEME